MNVVQCACITLSLYSSMSSTPVNLEPASYSSSWPYSSSRFTIVAHNTLQVFTICWGSFSVKAQPESTMPSLNNFTSSNTWLYVLYYKDATTNFKPNLLATNSSQHQLHLVAILPSSLIVHITNHYTTTITPILLYSTTMFWSSRLPPPPSTSLPTNLFTTATTMFSNHTFHHQT